MVVAGGAQHSLVLTTEGLFSFGRNDSGQLGCKEKLSKDDWGAFEKLPMEVSGRGAWNTATTVASPACVSPSRDSKELGNIFQLCIQFFF